MHPLQTVGLAPPWKPWQGQDKRPINTEQGGMSREGGGLQRSTRQKVVFIKGGLVHGLLLSTETPFSPLRYSQGRPPAPSAVGFQLSPLPLDPIQSPYQPLDIKGHLERHFEGQLASWKKVPDVQVASTVVRD